ncbi:MAG: hypothetical protein ACQESO_03505 [Bacillota bacterium]
MVNNPVNDKSNNHDLVFHIRVQYRRNSSMQGSIQWMDGKKSSYFRSILELGNLINEAREEAEGKNSTRDAGSKWEDKKSAS